MAATATKAAAKTTKKRGPKPVMEKEHGAVSFAGGQIRQTLNDLVRLATEIDDLDVQLGLDAKEGMARWPRPLACVETLALGATSRAAEIVPASKASYRGGQDAQRAAELAEFCRRNLVYLRESQRDVRSTGYLMLKWALVNGHQKAEVTRQTAQRGPDAGKSVLARIKLKSRLNTCFLVDERGNTERIGAYVGTAGAYSNPYAGGAMNAAGAAPFGSLGLNWRALPREKFWVLTHGGNTEDSPQGESVFRAAYVWWRTARDAMPLWLKALDNCAMPFTYATLPPPEYAQDAYPLKSDGTPDTDADMVRPQVHIYQAMSIARQGGVAVLPHGTDVKAIHNSSSGDPFAAFMERCNDEITYAILLQLLATGTDRHMARAAGEVHQDVLDMAIRNKRALVCASFNRDVLGPLIRDNFPEDHWHLTPSLSFGEVELGDFRAWAEAFATLNRDGLLHRGQLPHVHDVLGLPQPSQEDIAEAEALDETLREQLLTPEAKGDGTAGPSQLQKYAGQETGKRISRQQGRRHAPGVTNG